VPRPGKMIYLITYDLPSNPEGDRRRAKLARKLEAFGIRVQWSVFECELSPALYRQLREAMKDIIDPGEDSLRIYPICAACVREVDVIGRLDPCPRDEDCYVF
jgi:CRISPR-associated protein Cas2